MAELWKEISEYQDPELRHLASRLPKTVLKSQANTTTKKYLGAYGRWKEWAARKEDGKAFPIVVSKFALYLQYIGEKTESSSAVTEAINTVSWVQRLAGMTPVSENQLIKSIQEGFQRALAKPRRKKEPVTTEMLRKLVASMGPNPSLSEARLASLCLLAYAAFLRADEIIKLRCCDIKFTADGMEVSIRSSKTDQLRQGQVVPVAKTGNLTCPVSMLEKYTILGEIDMASELSLYRGISKVKGKEKLRAAGGLSYTRMRELVLGKIREMGYDAKEFGLHSFRAGGATMAASNPNVPERLFKRHGRWRSDHAKDGYIKESLENRLRVSKGLGL